MGASAGVTQTVLTSSKSSVTACPRFQREERAQYTPNLIPTLSASISAGLARLWTMPATFAARLKTTGNIPIYASRRSSMLPASPWMHWTPGVGTHLISSRPARRSRSKTVTLAPRSTSTLTRCEPNIPAPPRTKTGVPFQSIIPAPSLYGLQSPPAKVPLHGNIRTSMRPALPRPAPQWAYIASGESRGRFGPRVCGRSGRCGICPLRSSLSPLYHVCCHLCSLAGVDALVGFHHRSRQRLSRLGRSRQSLQQLPQCLRRLNHQIWKQPELLLPLSPDVSEYEYIRQADRPHLVGGRGAGRQDETAPSCHRSPVRRKPVAGGPREFRLHRIMQRDVIVSNARNPVSRDRGVIASLYGLSTHVNHPTMPRDAAMPSGVLDQHRWPRHLKIHRRLIQMREATTADGAAFKQTPELM